MSYDAPPPSREWPYCQAWAVEDVSDFPHPTYHACMGVDDPGEGPHVHVCGCDYTWEDDG